MVDQIEMVSTSFISFSLLVLAIGIMWSPLGVATKINSPSRSSYRRRPPSRRSPGRSAVS